LSAGAAGSPSQASTNKGVRLLVLQPTPFCNIDCDYCYLADRLSTKKMLPAQAVEIVDRLVSADVIGSDLSMVWHAGEPLTLPTSYYREIFVGLSSRRYPFTIRHSFQTNAMLINDEWCKFFKEWDVNVGVSVDGPAAIHDAHRKDRSGRGTHAKVMEGIRTLQRNSVPFHAIAVVTAESLLQPEAVFDFFLETGIDRIGFNIEELEGANSSSSVAGGNISNVRRFFECMAECQERCQNKITIREFENARAAIQGNHIPDSSLPELRNDQTLPLAIVTVAWDGSMTAFSPELIDAKSKDYGDFILGNILRDPISEIVDSPKYKRIAGAIQEGCKRCAETCQYFSVCGGGAPSNKYFENGSFESTETVYCRSVIQIPTDIMLAQAERELGIPVPQQSVPQQSIAQEPTRNDRPVQAA
jgi:uncharacterized protein